MFWNLQQMTDSIVAQLTGAHQATGKMSLASLLVTFPDTDIAVHGSPLSALLSEGRLIFISTFSEIWKPGLLVRLVPHCRTRPRLYTATQVCKVNSRPCSGFEKYLEYLG